MGFRCFARVFVLEIVTTRNGSETNAPVRTVIQKGSSWWLGLEKYLLINRVSNGVCTESKWYMVSGNPHGFSRLSCCRQLIITGREIIS